MLPLNPIEGSVAMLQGGERRSRSVIKNSVGARWNPMSAASEMGGSSGGTTRDLSI